MFWHGWLPVLLIVAAVAFVLWWANRPQPPLTLADEELAPYFPWGAHPVVLPQLMQVPSMSSTPFAPAASPVVVA